MVVVVCVGGDGGGGGGGVLSSATENTALLRTVVVCVNGVVAALVLVRYANATRTCMLPCMLPCGHTLCRSGAAPSSCLNMRIDLQLRTQSC